MPRTHWVAATLFAAFSLLPSLALSAGPSPIGTWQVSSGEARFAVANCGGGLCAKLVWLRSDVRNAKNLAYMNHYIVRDGQPKGAGQWTGNIVYDGKTYRSTMKLLGNNAMTLKGCSGVFCRTYKLSRV